MDKMTPQEIITQAESFGEWYHQVEVTPGYFTKSRMGPSFHVWDMIRRVRQGIDYKDKSVLDIGTMDGMWAFEAEEMGAEKVVACDIWQGDQMGMTRCEFAIKSKTSGLELRKFDAHCFPATWESQFDIIQCLGMLYHVENPLQVLREVHRCIAPSGLMLLETACVRSDLPYPWVMLNTRDDIYCDPTTFWVPNMIALTDMLKLTGFRIVQGTVQESKTEGRSYRTCMICALI